MVEREDMQLEVQVIPTGCMGLCSAGPLMRMMRRGGEETDYQKLYEWDMKRKQLAKQLETAEANEPANQPVLIHCQRGAERTGTLLAVYRMEHDGWSAEEAYGEMRQYKFRPMWFGHLKEYVMGYETDGPAD